MSDYFNFRVDSFHRRINFKCTQADPIFQKFCKIYFLIMTLQSIMWINRSLYQKL
ncbi:hypothetical protein pb186bvf_016210 [Paramecium bursaria]